MFNFDKKQPNNTIKVDNKVTRKPQLALYHSIYRVCQLWTNFPHGCRTSIADKEDLFGWWDSCAE